MHQFRLPLPELNRIFRHWGLATLAGVLLSHFVMPQRLGITISTTILLGIIAGGSYYVARKHVWLRMSADGISGTGYTGRGIQIAWHEPSRSIALKNRA